MSDETKPERTATDAPVARLRKLRKLSTYARGQGVLPEALAREDELRAMHVLLGTILSLPADARLRLLTYLIDAAGYETRDLRLRRPPSVGAWPTPPKPEPPPLREVRDGSGDSLLGRIKRGLAGPRA